MKKQRFYSIRALPYTIRKAVHGKDTLDDFDWSQYNRHYRGELEDLAQVNTTILRAQAYEFAAGKLSMNQASRPLHPNHALLYETILRLEPTTVLEAGCGGGDHLQNLSVLDPTLKLWGVDRSEDQIAFLKERHPHLAVKVSTCDLTLPYPSDGPRVDLAFTQAVIMHIRTGNGHLVALANLFQAAAKFVVLLENWTRHRFVDDIRFLADRKILPWSEIHLSYRSTPNPGGPRILIASSAPVASAPALTSYEQLTTQASAI